MHSSMNLVGSDKHQTCFPISDAAVKLATIAATSNRGITKTRESRDTAVRQEAVKDKKLPLKPAPKTRDTDKTWVQMQTSGRTNKVASQEHYSDRYTVSLGFHKAIRVAQSRRVASGNNGSVALLWDLSGNDAESELRMIQSIDHVAFVRCLSSYGTGNNVTVAFEYMPLSLVEVLSNRRLEEREIACILKQVVDGLLYLEEKGMGHRKLTSSNILIDDHSGRGGSNTAATNRLILFMKVSAF
ncbi:hypothetical protein FALBO_8851 [Fusarium albosuccineum]|uniref:Protein kinase domain-containing protein n=1 Tax=Fusarium albosuccineum TaxID=1237068 RepID=A0A8H4PB62_9HYPO|nr:hypothetical protein FALBO_8851 [Fusarium albosuccineum]